MAKVGRKLTNYSQNYFIYNYSKIEMADLLSIVDTNYYEVMESLGWNMENAKEFKKKSGKWVYLYWIKKEDVFCFVPVKKVPKEQWYTCFKYAPTLNFIQALTRLRKYCQERQLVIENPR